MISLEGIKDSEDDVTATLSLLAKVIRKVNKEVLKAKFGEYSKLLDEIFTSFSNTSNAKLLINVSNFENLLFLYIFTTFPNSRLVCIRRERKGKRRKRE